VLAYAVSVIIDGFGENFRYLHNLRNRLSQALTNAKVLINIILASII